MARQILPFDPSVRRLTPIKTRKRLGNISSRALGGLLDKGEIITMAVVPGVQAYIVESSVDAFLDRLNATATVAAQ